MLLWALYVYPCRDFQCPEKVSEPNFPSFSLILNRIMNMGLLCKVLSSGFFSGIRNVSSSASQLFRARADMVCDIFSRVAQMLLCCMM